MEDQQTVTEWPELTTRFNQKSQNASSLYMHWKIQIPLYCIIFTLAVVGNTLVIFTLARNHRMRTITNLFLLNLAVSDLLLGVLCMPFTLIGALLRDFVFGEIMCKLIPFLQACSVSVGAWTLVAISAERYYAICHPLRSLRWQTASHAYKTIFAIWIGSIIAMLPIACLSKLKPTKQGNHKCRENWKSLSEERAYNIFLDFILLLVPLFVLSIAYILITITLYRGMQMEEAFRDHCVTGSLEVFIHPKGGKKCKLSYKNSKKGSLHKSLKRGRSVESSFYQSTGLRRTNAERSLMNKKRVIKMLFAVVLEFFLCWTPIYVINTVALFNPSFVYHNLGSTGISFFHLLAYTSSCCNPITYCFMNKAFRKSFVNLCFWKKGKDSAFVTVGSEMNMDTRWVKKFPEPNT